MRDGLPAVVSLPIGLAWREAICIQPHVTEAAPPAEPQEIQAATPILKPITSLLARFAAISLVALRVLWHY